MRYSKKKIPGHNILAAFILIGALSNFLPGSYLPITRYELNKKENNTQMDQFKIEPPIFSGPSLFLKK